MDIGKAEQSRAEQRRTDKKGWEGIEWNRGIGGYGFDFDFDYDYNYNYACDDYDSNHEKGYNKYLQDTQLDTYLSTRPVPKYSKNSILFLAILFLAIPFFITRQTKKEGRKESESKIWGMRYRV